MNILVTGGAGFLGSHLCDALINDGDRVFCIDNMLTGSSYNIHHLWNHPNFYAMYTDISKVGILSFGRLHQIYHLASPAAPVDIQENPVATMDVNGPGTEFLLRLASQYDAKLLFVSTVKVHGECDRVNAYIQGKRHGESACLANNAKIARLANCYGPRMALTDSRVIPTFITQVLAKQPISLWNGGTQTDSFLYVTDAVRALRLLMNSDVTGAVEFGALEPTTIIDLANLIMEVCGIIVERHTNSVPVSAECHKVADTTKALELLNWSPSIQLRSGLELTIEDFKQRLRRSRA